MRRWLCIGAVAWAFTLPPSSSALLPSGFELAPQVEKRLRAFLAKEHCEDKYADPETRYSAAELRLGPGDQPLVLVYINSNVECGSGGCWLWLYRDTGRSFRVAAKIGMVNKPPISLLPTRTNGWRDLEVHIHEGADGVFPARLKYAAGRYDLDPKEYEASKRNGSPAEAVVIFPGYGDKLLCPSHTS